MNDRVEMNVDRLRYTLEIGYSDLQNGAQPTFQKRKRPFVLYEPNPTKKMNKDEIGT